MIGSICIELNLTSVSEGGLRKMKIKGKLNEVEKRLIATQDNWFMPLKEDILFCILAINNISISVYVFQLEPNSFADMKTIFVLTRVAYLGAWGMLFLLVGLGLFLCAVVIKDRKTKSQVLLWSCMIGFALWTLYSMLGVEIGQNDVTSTRNMSTAVIHLILCLIQVVELWRIRLQRKL